MKFIVSIIVLALLVGGAYYYFEMSENDMDADTMQEGNNMDDMSSDENVPEGYHRMPDGTLMKNDEMEDMNDDADMSMDMDASVSVDANVSTQTIDLNGFNFGYSQDEIRVKKGEKVTINLTSTDGYHDWVVDEFNVASAKVNTGETTSVTFIADKAGTYEFYCSVGSHRAQGMKGTLIVE